jgi:hypothetical protein
MNSELLILAISLVLIVVGVLLWQKGNHLLATGKKAKAIVFKNNYNAGVGQGGGAYYTVVRFLTDKQEWITQELSVGYSPAIEEGTELDVVYDPDDPTTVEINSSFQLEVLPRLLFVLGVCGLLLGFLEILEITQFVGD